MFITCCIVEAAVKGLNVIALNNSEVIVTWEVPEFPELQNFVVRYIGKPEQKEPVIVDRPLYQISDLIPGEDYTVQVSPRYRSTSGEPVEAEAAEDKVALERIGMYVCMMIIKVYVVTMYYSKIVYRLCTFWHHLESV